MGSPRQLLGSPERLCVFLRSFVEMARAHRQHRLRRVVATGLPTFAPLRDEVRRAGAERVDKIELRTGEKIGVLALAPGVVATGCRNRQRAGPPRAGDSRNPLRREIRRDARDRRRDGRMSRASARAEGASTPFASGGFSCSRTRTMRSRIVDAFGLGELPPRGPPSGPGLASLPQRVKRCRRSRRASRGLPGAPRGCSSRSSSGARSVHAMVGRRMCSAVQPACCMY